MRGLLVVLLLAGALGLSAAPAEATVGARVCVQVAEGVPQCVGGGGDGDLVGCYGIEAPLLVVYVEADACA